MIPGFDSKAMSCGRANHDVCKWNLEFGSGFQCRKDGIRNKASADTYHIKGVYSAVKCDSANPVIVYSKIRFNWFKAALGNPLNYALRVRK